MKTRVIEAASPAKPPYPRLMRKDNSTRIVFFTSPTTGWVVHSEENQRLDCNRVGYSADTWAPQRFTPFYGKVEIDGSPD